MRFIGTALLCLAATSPIAAAESPEELYAKGITAYKEDDYLSAIKNLYAFSEFYRLSNREMPEDFRAKIAEALAYSERQLIRSCGPSAAHRPEQEKSHVRSSATLSRE